MAAVASLALLVAGVSACGSSTSAPPTTRVQRGEVATRVSASGALASVTSQNLGFAQGAQLKELDVRVGDVVKPGQVLAREDDFAFQQLLAQQQANLATAQANLNKANSDLSVPDARKLASQQRTIYDKTKDQVDASNDQAESATKRARVAFEASWHQLYQARQALAKCLRNPANNPGTSTPTTTPPTMAVNPPDPTSPTDASDTNDPTSAASMASAGSMASMSSGAPATGSTSGSTGLLGSSLTKAVTPAAATATDPGCTTAKSTYTSAVNAAIQAKTALVSAKRQEDVTHETNEVSLANAKQQIIL
ncbi:MAG TPA: efflux RND transporter periplasmic adaptor subunit, partial [Pseudonocardiaceae bacterium]